MTTNYTSGHGPILEDAHFLGIMQSPAGTQDPLDVLAAAVGVV